MINILKQRSLTYTEDFLNNSFTNCILAAAKALVLVQYYGFNFQKHVFFNDNLQISCEIAGRDEALMISIRIIVKGLDTILNFAAIWNLLIKILPPSATNSTYELIKVLNENINRPNISFTKKLLYKFTLSDNWTSKTTFKLASNHKLTRSFEYCPLIKIEYTEFDHNYGFIETATGCLVLSLNFKTLKVINLKYSAAPTEPEFEILLNIIYEKISDSNFEDILFKDDFTPIYQVPYTKGLDNIGNTCFMNSALQLILNNPNFQEFFQTISRIDDFQFDRTKFPLLNATNLLFMKLRYNNPPHKELKQLKRVMGDYIPMFKSFDQQDSNEFLQCYLGHLHKEFILYFSKSLRYNNIPQKEDVNELKTYRKLNNSYFNNLFLGFAKTCLTCGICDKSDSVTLPILNLQLDIPQKKFVQFAIKLIPFDTSGSQKVKSIKISIQSNLLIESLKLDLEKLISAPKDRLVLSIQIDLDKNTKELKVIQDESKKVQELSEIGTDLYCFELPESYTDDDRGYIIINQGTNKFGRFKHLGYNLFSIYKFKDFNFKHFYESLADNMLRVSKFQPNTIKKRMANQLVDVPYKFKKLAVTNSKSIFGDSKILCDKPEEFSPYYDNLFSIFKVNRDYSEKYPEKALLPIQTNAQFYESLPIANGDNLFIIWNEPCFDKNNVKPKYPRAHPINSNHQSQCSKQSRNFESVILEPLHSFSLSFIDWAKDLISGKMIDIGKPEYQPSLKDCINDYLKPVYFVPHSNPILNWECEYCGNNFGEKRDFIKELPQYLLVNFNRSNMEQCFNNSKNTQFVECPLEFYFNENQKLIKYSLIGIIDHFGNFSGGHYTAACKNSIDGQWRNFNDTCVSQVDENNVISYNAQILMYQRNDSVISKKSLNLDLLPLKYKYFKSFKYEYILLIVNESDIF